MLKRVYCFGNEVLKKLCYNSVWSMCVRWWHIHYRSLLAILRKKVSEPKEEIGNLNGFECMYLSGLTVPYL
jgi:hypothetical protein